MIPQLPACSDPSLISHLRAWLDPVPRRADGALPPGVVAPDAPPQPAETDVLTVELSLRNLSRQPRQARVLGASWHQGERRAALPWRQQPDLSPLNRFNVNERQLLVLRSQEPVRVEMELDLDGHRCRLLAWTGAATGRHPQN